MAVEPVTTAEVARQTLPYGDRPLGHARSRDNNDELDVYPSMAFYQWIERLAVGFTTTTGNVTNITTTVNSTVSSINTIEADITAIEATLTLLQEEIDAISVGSDAVPAPPAAPGLTFAQAFAISFFFG